MAGITPMRDSSALLHFALAELIKEHGTANEDWTRATLTVSDAVLTDAEMPVVNVDHDVSSLSYKFSVSLVPEKEEPAPKKERNHPATSVCLNCLVNIFKDRETSSTWYHEGTDNTNCAGGKSWARPGKISRHKV